jgi:hypothetical protein
MNRKYHSRLVYYPIIDNNIWVGSCVTNRFCIFMGQIKNTFTLRQGHASCTESLGKLNMDFRASILFRAC